MRDIGSKEMAKHLAGKKLTLGQAAKAKCYDCTGGYADGKDSCCVSGCSLYPFHPYNPAKSILPAHNLQGNPESLARHVLEAATEEYAGSEEV